MLHTALPRPRRYRTALNLSCVKKHKAITLTPNELKLYIGSYATSGQSNEQFKGYTGNNKLYYSDGGLPPEIISFTNDGFFSYENQKAEMFFYTEGSKCMNYTSPAIRLRFVLTGQQQRLDNHLSFGFIFFFLLIKISSKLFLSQCLCNSGKFHGIDP
jgi:hypothetical protein